MKPILTVCAMSVLVCATLAAQSPATDATPPVIVAQGEALLQRPPDVAWVQIAVETRADKPEPARQSAADAMTLVLAAVRKQVPEEAIKTAAYSVTPEFDYTTSGSRLKGYVARNRIEVRVDTLDRLSSVMDTAIVSGAASVTGIRFDVKARTDLERDALRLSVQDALARARAIALGAGKTVGSIVRVQEQRVTSPRIATSSGESSYAVSGGRGVPTPVPIAPGEIDIRAITVLTVTIAP